ncbi:MAG: hypothetical protein CM1200mP11_1480 [Nitrosopumilaceae archaeon]|nr:MAG: hypothetical protein CM1200mP11_1480 [Nitrosopumilaceae archaeon]
MDKPISKHELKEHQEMIKHLLTKGNLVESNNRIIPNFEKIKFKFLKDYSIRGLVNQ